ncbi:STM3941 family protein [Mycolicibacillus trivialis]|nr:STM3941 family protein [Mycolicibacillus trivialis]
MTAIPRGKAHLMPFEARVSRIKVFGLMIGCVVFVVGGLWIAGVLGDGADATIFHRIIGWLSVVFFGLCLPVSVGRLIRGGLALRVDAEGIYWRQWSEQVIPWTAIRAAHVAAVRRQWYLNLDLYDPAAYPSKTILGWVKRLNTGMGYGDISLNVIATDHSFADLVAAFDRFAPAELRPGSR